MITALIFIGRNSNRLIKEYKIYSYEPFTNVNYPLHDDGFRYRDIFKKKIKENQAVEIYKNQVYILLDNINELFIFNHRFFYQKKKYFFLKKKIQKY